MSDQPFSKRHGYRGPAAEITIREDATENLRYFVLDTARQYVNSVNALRMAICRVLRTPPDTNNWSDGNVWDEVQSLIYGADWFKVYDIIEAIHTRLVREQGTGEEGAAPGFVAAINDFFVEEGIGWQLVDGEIVTRGPESFQAAVINARGALIETERPTAAGHIHEALQALSRRPAPDLSGAVYHAMGTLEAVARQLVDDEKATLGEILKHHPDLVPPPLDKALSQMWGFASNVARHVVEGRDPTREEAELVVGVAATVATYLARKGS